MTEASTTIHEGDAAVLLGVLHGNGLDPARTCGWAWDPAPTRDSIHQLKASGQGACPFLAADAPPLLEGHAFWLMAAGSVCHLLVLPTAAGGLRWSWHEWNAENVPHAVSVLWHGADNNRSTQEGVVQ